VQARQDHGETPSPRSGTAAVGRQVIEQRPSLPRTEDAAAESDSSNDTLCDNCSKALQKPLVCARCKTAASCSKDCQVLKTVIE
jgi:hypothetical protein